ncbi:MAG: type I restriction enzyme HsdR N-terminal domain-containing protein [Chitinophagaceae bacterium]
MIRLPLLEHSIKTRGEGEQTEVWDIIRKAWFKLTPEEHVRQLLLQHFIEVNNYPPSVIAVERSVQYGESRLRFDIAVYHRDNFQPWLLVECKAPEIPIDETVLQQLLRYHNKLPECSFWLITNGHQSFCADARDKANILWMDRLPTY